MAQIEFEDNTEQIIEEMRSKAIAWLEEAGGEIKSQAASNSRRVSGDTAGSFECKVDTENMACAIGSPKINAVYEEFGTGEYALKGDGHKGWWVYVEGSDNDSGPSKTYTEQEARRAVAYLRSKGLPAHMTKGKRGTRALFNAFNSLKGQVQNKAQMNFRDLGD